MMREEEVREPLSVLLAKERIGSFEVSRTLVATLRYDIIN